MLFFFKLIMFTLKQRKIVYKEHKINKGTTYFKRNFFQETCDRRKRRHHVEIETMEELIN